MFDRPTLLPDFCLLSVASLRRFWTETCGTLVVWFLFMVVGILMAVGLGIDTFRTEGVRLQLQHTVDRAILAAADLDQERDPEEVVRDYVERAGLPRDAVQVRANETSGQKTVEAQIVGNVDTILTDLIGLDSMVAPAYGSATDALVEVDISLILDNSGSMGWNNNRRLNLLKPAAKDFVDAVIKPGPGGVSPVSISLVPFATQVNAGPVLGGALNMTDEHTYSHCAEFAPTSYSDEAIDPALPLQRAGHFDRSTFNAPVTTFGVVCPFDASRHILPWSQDTDALKAQIDSMWAGGNTSIDIATKWGAALLDPAFQPVLSELAGQGDVNANLIGRPYAYGGGGQRQKVLVVMSDGENTQQWRLNDAYASGPSPVYKEPGTGIVSYFDADRGQYFVFDNAAITSSSTGTWQDAPAGGDEAAQMTWPEVWNAWSVRRFARDIKQKAIGGDWGSYANAVYSTQGASAKRTRTREICAAARAQGVIIYSIGMDTYGEGDAVLSACAGDSLRFFDVEAKDIGAAFSSIARQINQLRLTN